MDQLTPATTPAKMRRVADAFRQKRLVFLAEYMKAMPLREISEHPGRGYDENTVVGQFIDAYQERLLPTGSLPTDPAVGSGLYRLATAELGDTKARNLLMEMLMFGRLNDELLGGWPFWLHNRDSTTARNLRAPLAQCQLLGEDKPTPTFTLADNTSKKVSLSDFKDKVM